MMDVERCHWPCGRWNRFMNIRCDCRISFRKADEVVIVRDAKGSFAKSHRNICSTANEFGPKAPLDIAAQPPINGREHSLGATVSIDISSLPSMDWPKHETLSAQPLH